MPESVYPVISLPEPVVPLRLIRNVVELSRTKPEIEFAMFVFADENYGTSDTLLTNFGGCPPYAITGTVYSDANGYGKFKYAVPSGYYAVCTKNLAEYG